MAAGSVGASPNSRSRKPGDGLHRVYRVEFEHATLVWLMTTDHGGKILALEPKPK
jgi:hypothetical protein